MFHFYKKALAKALALSSLLIAMTAGPVPVLAQTPPPTSPAPPSSSDLMAHKTKDGILFQCVAPGSAATVFLAGDFNQWANNTASVITDPQFKMDGPDAKGVFAKTVHLDPGAHKFKFVINGTWTTPDWVKERDPDDNGIIYVSMAGDVLTKNPVNADWRTTQKDGKVTFQLYYPQAKSVFIAGDFNNWGSVKDDTVSDPNCAMQGPDANGVWQMTVALSPGTHSYKFVINGNSWEVDPNNDKVDAQGNSAVEVTK